jgi:hypothetical protein
MWELFSFNPILKFYIKFFLSILISSHAYIYKVKMFRTLNPWIMEPIFVDKNHLI